jgi:hypothetical protein
VTEPDTSFDHPPDDQAIHRLGLEAYARGDFTAALKQQELLLGRIRQSEGDGSGSAVMAIYNLSLTLAGLGRLFERRSTVEAVLDARRLEKSALTCQEIDDLHHLARLYLKYHDRVTCVDIWTVVSEECVKTKHHRVLRAKARLLAWMAKRA